ncbi:HAD family phosphatase [Bacteroidales bacterium OttesenSCG-928-M11]|nr:HAD family phosphatase [Bacteroidales bacterium OttesenSCG-928-M11]
MNLNGIKNIVFDLGGVLITLNINEAIRRFKAIGLENIEEFLDPYHQKGIFLALEDGSMSAEAFYDAVRKEAGKDISDKDIIWAWLGFIEDLPVYKLKMLDNLRQQGYKLYLLSNTNPCVMSWAMSSDFSPEGKTLADYFDKCYLSYQQGCVKPDVRIFDSMIKDSGIIPQETLFIDDGKANVEMGNQLGFHTYQPINGSDFREELGLID